MKVDLTAIKAKLEWLRPIDKQGHMWAGVALALFVRPIVCIALGFVPALVQALVTLCVVAAIAAIKEEVVDRKTGGVVDSKDAYATIVGGLLGLVLGYVVLPLLKLVL